MLDIIKFLRFNNLCQCWLVMEPGKWRRSDTWHCPWRAGADERLREKSVAGELAALLAAGKALGRRGLFNRFIETRSNKKEARFYGTKP